MPKDAPPAMSTYGMREQNVLAVLFHSGSDERPNFANRAKIKRLLVPFHLGLRIRPEFVPERT